MIVAAGVGETFARTVTDGPLIVAALVAVVAGLVSFLSPCVLPLVPPYLCYMAGVSVEDFDRRKSQDFWRSLVDSIPAWDRLIQDFNAEVGGRNST